MRQQLASMTIIEQPEAPSGGGWFVGSIHDTEDGAVCIWLRNKSVPSPEIAAIARQFEQMKEMHDGG